jgi:D-amino-acid dehydrogenase
VKTIVIGAGVIGTATAYFLHKQGDEVIVVDRQDGAALETSFANGSIIHASEVEPWSRPGMPQKILSWLGREDAPLLLRFGALPQMWRWGLDFLGNCTAERFHENALANLRLALYSLETLQEIAAETGIAYDRSQSGVLKIYRDPKSLESAVQGWESIVPHGLNYRTLTPDQCTEVEPALASTAHTLAGGLYFPRDEVGDCHAFTQGLARHLEERGVVYHYGTAVDRLNAEGDAVRSVETSRGALAADRFVIAAGSYTPLLLRPLGINLPIYPVKGVSVTVSSRNWNGAPKVPILDDSGMYGFVPVGDRLRVAGSAEITGYDTVPSQTRAKAIVERAIEAFPEFARCYDPATAKVWAGLRPVTPSGTAYMGRTSIANLFVNAGHGHLGWTMACGAGRAVAAIVAGERPGVDLSRFPRTSG